jgi:xanthine dehydrogenase molybdopterin-binding subunit B
MLEAIMEHAAAELGLEPLELRLNNLMMEGSPILPPPATLPTPCPIPDMMNTVTASSSLQDRQAAAAAFNEVILLYCSGTCTVNIMGITTDKSFISFD